MYFGVAAYIHFVNEMLPNVNFNPATKHLSVSTPWELGKACKHTSKLPFPEQHSCWGCRHYSSKFKINLVYVSLTRAGIHPSSLSPLCPSPLPWTNLSTVTCWTWWLMPGYIFPVTGLNYTTLSFPPAVSDVTVA